MTDREKMAREMLADECAANPLEQDIALYIRAGNDSGILIYAETARDAITAAYNKGRADMREEAVDKLINADRSGREWVRDSLWASIFRDGIAAIRAIPVEGE